MPWPLRRTAVLLLAVACTRAPSTAPAPGGTTGASAPAPSAARGTAVALAAATRAVPPPPPLGDIRPRAPGCLPSRPDAPAGALVEEAEAALDRGDDGRGLACAEEALRLAPRLLAALTARGDALLAHERVDDARLSFGLALAVDPDDPFALLGAADLHVRRLGRVREALETGLVHAERGLRIAGRLKDRDLTARFELLAGIALNDLGRSELALRHLDVAVAARPDDAKAVYERGVAYYELCRFAEAQRAFERALTLSPDDPWTIHQLGLVAERRGEGRTAEALLAKARALAPDEFRADLVVDADAFRAEVEAAIAALPELERAALRLAPVEIVDLPAAADLLAVDPPLSPTILGLFRGPSEDEPCVAADGPRCRSIVFYRKNLVRFAKDRRELAEQVRVTLLHELGHLHGESEDELRARGLE
jgi:tetratricopeptide (TPR) repeat protein